MTDSLKKEIENINKYYNIFSPVDHFDKFIPRYIWNDISEYQNLSEEFIENFNEKLNWYYISKDQILSESFIEKFKDDVDWNLISSKQKLSEFFIEKFKYYVNWDCISSYQKLSEPFIEKFKDEVRWDYISKYQNLSEPFIEKFQNKVNWYRISIFQKLSESFIENFRYYVDWNNISEYQKISEKFRKKYKIKTIKNNINYMTKKEINKLIPDCYEKEGDYIIAYKNIRKDRYSHYNFQYKYEKGGTYDCHCDCNNDEENSFGLSLWTKEQANTFNKRGIVIKCRVRVENIGAIVHEGNKLRCKRIEVLT